MSLLKLAIIGRLGRDAQVRSVNNSYVINFSVAYSERNRQGEEFTTWVNCSYWRNSFDQTKIVEYLKKGKLVYVEGTPSVRTYTSNTGETRASLDCRVTTIRLLGGREDIAPVATPAEAPATTTSQETFQQTSGQEPDENLTLDTPSEETEDDLPF